MNPRKRLLLLMLIIALIVAFIESATVWILYKTSMGEERARLEEIVKREARLIEAMTRFNKIYSADYPSGPRQATLSQIRNAHSKFQGFGKTGEFTLAIREGDSIVFLLRHRHHDMEDPAPVPWDSALSEPMRRALLGRAGTIIGLDYRGEVVLAAYEPVAELNAGVVAKIDLSEIRSPFVKAILLTVFIGVGSIAFGAGLFLKLTEPIITKLYSTIELLEKTLGEVKTLRGIVPICSFCKKIRNDQGYWDQVEVYVKAHTEADFSHGVCPDCLKQHYPDFVMDGNPEK